MENTLENTLLAFISKTLNMDTVKVTELLKTVDGESIKDNALQSLLDLDVARVTTIKEGVEPTDGKTQFDNGYKKAQGEILTKFEGEVSTHYAVGDTQLKGLDLIKHVITTKSKAAEDNQITPDEIKLTPTYLDAVKKVTDEKETELGEQKLAHDKVINGFEKTKKLAVVFDKADAFIDGTLKPIFSKDAARALSQRKKIHEIIGGNDYKVGEDGRVTPLTADGNLLEDEHSNPVDFNSIVKDATTSLLDLPSAEDRSGAGAGDDGGDGGAGAGAMNWNGQKPKDDAEYIKLVNDSANLDEKKALRKSYYGN